MDIELYYQQKGCGQPLILLHGNGENSDCFQAQIEEFSKYFHVYAIDTRGHGKTLRGTKPFTIRQFAKDLANFMDLHQIPQAHLLGFSDGGNIAIIFALQYPERILKLVLNGANLDPKGMKRSVLWPIEIEYAFYKRFAKRNESAKLKAEMLGLMINDPHIPVAELSKIQHETLVIAGTNDMIQKQHTQCIANHIAHAQLAILSGDHFIAYKQPTAFNQRVLAFLFDDQSRMNQEA